MQESETDKEKEETADQPAEEEYSSRKHRTTPRQLWKSTQQQADEAASRRLKVRPIDENADEETEQPAEAETPSEPLEPSPPADQTPQTNSFADEDMTAREAPEPTESPRETGQNTEEPAPAASEPPPPSEETEEPEDAPPPEEPDEAQPAPPTEGPEEELTAEEEPGVRMVGPDKQPGMMRYPYATHGPAPEEGEGSGASERTVSSSFVLGIILIVGALLAGLVLVALQSQIRHLEDRFDRLEAAFQAQNPDAEIDLGSADR